MDHLRSSLAPYSLHLQVPFWAVRNGFVVWIGCEVMRVVPHIQAGRRIGALGKLKR